MKISYGDKSAEVHLIKSDIDIGNWTVSFDFSVLASNPEEAAKLIDILKIEYENLINPSPISVNQIEQEIEIEDYFKFIEI